MRKAKIDWKVAPEVDRNLRLPPHIREVPINQNLKAAMIGCLQPGHMWKVAVDLNKRVYPPDVVMHPLPVYERTYWGPAPDIKTGAVAVYTGTIRVEELGAKGSIRVPRHTFIIGGVGRVIIPDLNCVFPI